MVADKMTKGKDKADAKKKAGFYVGTSSERKDDYALVSKVLRQAGIKGSALEMCTDEAYKIAQNADTPINKAFLVAEYVDVMKPFLRFTTSSDNPVYAKNVFFSYEPCHVALPDESRLELLDKAQTIKEYLYLVDRAEINLFAQQQSEEMQHMVHSHIEGIPLSQNAIRIRDGKRQNEGSDKLEWYDSLQTMKDKA